MNVDPVSGAVTVEPALNSSQLESLFEVIQTNFSAAIPWGLGILGIFLGLSIIKRVVFSFM